jgi:tetraacyldisaccharide 4'-kinase
LDASAFRDLVSGRRRGWSAALARGLLAGLEVPYRGVVRARNACYDRGLKQIHTAAVPVISVGNLTLGGTGKSPFVQWLADWLTAREVRVVIVSRGYKSEAGRPNDEALELAQKLPDVPHIQDRDRVRAAQQAVQHHACQAIVLDDGFQHRRLHRDLDIVLVDALDPFGCERVFPRGTLREPLSAMARADVVALSRSDAVSWARRDAIRSRVGQLAPGAAWLELAHQPIGWRSAGGQRRPIGELAARDVAAFCGIGNPAGFRHTLETCGCRLVGFREFPDHYRYGQDGLQQLSDWAAQFPADAIAVCTHKDLVKLGPNPLGSRPVWALEIGLEIRAGQEQLEQQLGAVVENRHLG